MDTYPLTLTLVNVCQHWVRGQWGHGFQHSLCEVFVFNDQDLKHLEGQHMHLGTGRVQSKGGSHAWQELCRPLEEASLQQPYCLPFNPLACSTLLPMLHIPPSHPPLKSCLTACDSALLHSISSLTHSRPAPSPPTLIPPHIPPLSPHTPYG